MMCQSINFGHINHWCERLDISISSMTLKLMLHQLTSSEVLMAYKYTLLYFTILVCVLGVFGTALAMTIKYWLIPELASFKHHQGGTCQVMACNRTTSVCDGQLCDVISIAYGLLNQTMFTPYHGTWVVSYNVNTLVQTLQCPLMNSTIRCYYDDRNVPSTLTLLPFDDYAYGPNTMIGVIGSFMGIILVTGLIGLIYVWRQDREYHTYQTQRRVTQLQSSDPPSSPDPPVASDPLPGQSPIELREVSPTTPSTMV
jgi:hypothetical protein